MSAIRVKLLKARLHQPSSTISILSASPRRFGSEQWSLLEKRLESWKNSISNIQDTVGRALGNSPNQRQEGGRQQQQGVMTAGASAQEVVNAAQENQQQQQAVVEVA
jgi:hypothetical protein